MYRCVSRISSSLHHRFPTAQTLSSKRQRAVPRFAPKEQRRPTVNVFQIVLRALSPVTPNVFDNVKKGMKPEVIDVYLCVTSAQSVFMAADVSRFVKIMNASTVTSVCRYAAKVSACKATDASLHVKMASNSQMVNVNRSVTMTSDSRTATA
jgi:hypothetical protein